MNLDILGAALRFHRLGLKLVELGDRSKKPVHKEWQRYVLATEPEIRAAFGNGKTRNIGLALGGKEGITDGDADSPEAAELASELAAPTGFVYGRAGRPGAHRIYRCQPACQSFVWRDPVPQADGKANAVILELRGANKDPSTYRQSVAPPSIWRDDPKDPAHEELVEFVPGASLEIASVDPIELHRAYADAYIATLLSSPQRFALAGHRHHTLLALAGWWARGGVPEERALRILRAVSRRVRPEKHSDGDVHREIKDSYQKVADGAEATGYPTLFQVLPQAHLVLPAIAEALGFQEKSKAGTSDRIEAWPELIPFTQCEPDPIPTDSLPGWAGEMAQAVSANAETPFDLAGLLTLGVNSSCIAGKVLVSPEPGYVEPTNLYVCPTMDSGTRKTYVFNSLLEPVIDWENSKALLLEPEQTRIARERRILELQIQNLSKVAGSAKDPKAEFEKIHQLEERLPVVPPTPQLFCEDCTPEALALLMKENGERMAVFSDEGGPFDVLTGIRYSGNSGGTPNLDLILKAHSGSPVRVNRVNLARLPIRLKHPCLTIAVSPQPDVLEALKNKPGFRGRGLLARFLYALPKSPLGYRLGECPPIPEHTRKEYEVNIKKLLDLVFEGPLVLTFSPPGYALWKDFQRMVEQHLREGGLLFSLKDWGGKLPGGAARIAGVLHAMTPAFLARQSVEIQEDTILRAIELATSLLFHARAAFSLMERDHEIENAQKIAAWIIERKLTSFGTRECFRAHQSRFKRVDAMGPAIKLLIDHGYIQRTKQDSTGGRPPSDQCDVNPTLFDQKEKA